MSAMTREEISRATGQRVRVKLLREGGWLPPVTLTGTLLGCGERGLTLTQGMGRSVLYWNEISEVEALYTPDWGTPPRGVSEYVGEPYAVNDEDGGMDVRSAGASRGGWFRRWWRRKRG